MPGVSSRLGTDKTIEGLMKLERIPRDRVQQEKEGLEQQKTYWQEVNRRMASMRDSARQLYSYQNPFNDRVVTSSDASVLTGTAARQASSQTMDFIVKRIAQADRFLSDPLDASFKVEAGTYTFTAGGAKVSLDFKGGGVKEFADALNRRGQGKIGASVITVQNGKQSLLIESKTPGAENKLVFASDAAAQLGLQTGILAPKIAITDIPVNTETTRGAALPAEPAAALDAGAVENTPDAAAGQDAPAESETAAAVSGEFSVDNGVIDVGAESGAAVVFPNEFTVRKGMEISFETATKLLPAPPMPNMTPPPGPALPEAGSAAYNGVVIGNAPFSVPIPEWKPPEPPKRVDDMNVFSLAFSDGTSLELPPLADSDSFTKLSFPIPDTEIDKTIVSLTILNKNTNREALLQHIQIADPSDTSQYTPKNPISTAQDAEVTMDGVTVTRPSNTIDDLLPGVTINLKKPSDKPANVTVEADKESVKNTIIAFVGNYNRLMAEINVLTRNDERVVDELTYLSEDEISDLRKRLAAFSSDATLTQYKNALQNAVTAPYPTAGGTFVLASFGIGTDMRGTGGGGYDPSRLRGYLEIDEKKLDEALDTRLTDLQQVFGYDTNGDLIVDSGAAYAVETLTRPYVETGGLIAMRTSTLDSRIKADDQRIATMDRQLEDKEATLRAQYNQMENAFNRMEQMSNSLDNFSKQNSGGK
jgi:flagellar hook-associated protein 2